MKDISLDQLSAQHFKDALRTTFQVTMETGAAVPLELISVTELVTGAPLETFSLLFNGPPEQALTQRTYHFTHEKLVAFDLFIVPVRADAKGRQYEAIVNRRRTP